MYPESKNVLPMMRNADGNHLFGRVEDAQQLPRQKYESTCAECVPPTDQPYAPAQRLLNPCKVPLPIEKRKHRHKTGKEPLRGHQRNALELRVNAERGVRRRRKGDQKPVDAIIAR